MLENPLKIKTNELKKKVDSLIQLRPYARAGIHKLESDRKLNPYGVYWRGPDIYLDNKTDSAVLILN